MINPSACSFEEMYRNEDEGYTVFYFIYPKDMTETRFNLGLDEFTDDDVQSMCISVTVYDYGAYDMMMSPTVIAKDDENGQLMLDIDWEPLESGVNYTHGTFMEIMKLVPRK